MKNLLPTFSSFLLAVRERWRVRERLNVCRPAFVCLCVNQSGCLLLAARCRLINFDRLPLRPTTNTSSKEPGSVSTTAQSAHAALTDSQVDLGNSSN